MILINKFLRLLVGRLIIGTLNREGTRTFHFPSVSGSLSFRCLNHGHLARVHCSGSKCWPLVMQWERGQNPWVQCRGFTHGSRRRQHVVLTQTLPQCESTRPCDPHVPEYWSMLASTGLFQCYINNPSSCWWASKHETGWLPRDIPAAHAFSHVDVYVYKFYAS